MRQSVCVYTVCNLSFVCDTMTTYITIHQVLVKPLYTLLLRYCLAAVLGRDETLLSSCAAHSLALLSFSSTQTCPHNVRPARDSAALGTLWQSSL